MKIKSEPLILEQMKQMLKFMCTRVFQLKEGPNFCPAEIQEPHPHPVVIDMPMINITATQSISTEMLNQ